MQSYCPAINHRCNIHIYTRQTGLSWNVHNIYTQQTSIQDGQASARTYTTFILRKYPYKTVRYRLQQVSVATRLNTYTPQTSIWDRQLLVATDVALTIYAQQACQREFLINLITLLNGMASKSPQSIEVMCNTYKCTFNWEILYYAYICLLLTCTHTLTMFTCMIPAYIYLYVHTYTCIYIYLHVSITAHALINPYEHM